MLASMLTRAHAPDHRHNHLFPAQMDGMVTCAHAPSCPGVGSQAPGEALTNVIITVAVAAIFETCLFEIFFVTFQVRAHTPHNPHAHRCIVSSMCL